MKATLSSLAAGSSKNKFKQNCFINNYTTAPNGLVAMAISYRITSIQIKKKKNNNKRNWAEDEQCNRWMGKGGKRGKGEGGRVDGRTHERSLCFVMRVFVEVSEESLRKEKSEMSWKQHVVPLSRWLCCATSQNAAFVTFWRFLLFLKKIK